MNKTNYLTFSGLLMCLAGALMLISENIGVSTSKILVPLSFAGGGIFAYLFASANKHHSLASQYHTLQGIGMIAFAVLIAIGPKSLDGFLQFVIYFMLLFGIIEILFGFMALNTGGKLKIGILISRFIAGFFNLIAAVLILATSATDLITGLMIAGILIILGGIAFVIFSLQLGKLQKKA